MSESLSESRSQEEDECQEQKLAKESDKITKAREKLEQRLKNQGREVTEENLNEKIAQIHDRIARQAEVRVFVKKSSLSLFDNNQNPAKSSSKVSKYAKNIIALKTVHISEKIVEASLKNRTIEAQ